MAGEAVLFDTNVLIAYVREGRLAEVTATFSSRNHYVQ